MLRPYRLPRCLRPRVPAPARSQLRSRAVRDSKDAAGPVLHVSRNAWAGFVGLATAK
ncbi:DUF397 domain-containing protein [Streptomyces sp. SID9727]|nr:DUF397 domain-containing protein [Streptomyces sp. SID9727]